MPLFPKGSADQYLDPLKLGQGTGPLFPQNNNKTPCFSTKYLEIPSNIIIFAQTRNVTINNQG